MLILLNVCIFGTGCFALVHPLYEMCREDGGEVVERLSNHMSEMVDMIFSKGKMVDMIFSKGSKIHRMIGHPTMALVSCVHASVLVTIATACAGRYQECRREQ